MSVPRETRCHAVGCDRPIAKKHVLCRPCAVAKANDRFPYTAPCEDNIREPIPWHLNDPITCHRCGFPTRDHPGRATLRLERVAIAW